MPAVRPRKWVGEPFNPENVCGASGHAKDLRLRLAGQGKCSRHAGEPAGLQPSRLFRAGIGRFRPRIVCGWWGFVLDWPMESVGMCYVQMNPARGMIWAEARMDGGKMGRT